MATEVKALYNKKLILQVPNDVYGGTSCEQS